LGGKFLLKLNITAKPIVNKYRKGKLKRTLKRELKELEIAYDEGNIRLYNILLVRGTACS